MGKPTKQKSRLHMTHAQNDARYVAQGMTLYLAPNPHSERDLTMMNSGKNGRPFKYEDEIIMAIAGIRYRLRISYRECEGLAIAALGKEKAPDYTTLCRRINRMNVTSVEETIEVKSKKSILRLIPDGTGLVPSTRSDWIRHMYKVKRGWIRLSVMIDHDTQKILAFRVTDERTGDSPQFEGLMEDSLKCLGIDSGDLQKKAKEPADEATKSKKTQPARISDVVKKALESGEAEAEDEQLIATLADGAYDSKQIHSFCRKHGILSLVKVDLNANSKASGVDRARALAAQDQLCGEISGPRELAVLHKYERIKNQKKWKEKVGYGRRWLVEIVFSSFKRRFGDAVQARTMKNIVNEIGIKVKIYNRLLDIAQEAIAKA